MATYRTVYVSFWDDPKVDDDFTPEDKYFYLYLLTNPHANLCGCYEISMKQMVRETGYNEDTVKRLLDRMEKIHGVIQYDSDAKEVFIPNWHKYNWANSPKTISGAIAVAKSVKTIKFRKALNEILIGYGYPMDTLSIPPRYPMDTSVTVPVTDTVSVTDTGTGTDRYEPTIHQSEFSMLRINRDGSYSLKGDSENMIRFEDFIREYPNPVDEDEARIIWERMNPSEETAKAIMAGLDEWKQSAQWENPQFIPYPANWLSRKRWEQKPKRKVGSGQLLSGQNYEQKPIPKIENLPNLI